MPVGKLGILVPVPALCVWLVLRKQTGFDLEKGEVFLGPRECENSHAFISLSLHCFRKNSLGALTTTLC